MRTLLLSLALVLNSCGEDGAKGMHSPSTSDQKPSELTKATMPVEKKTLDSSFLSFWRIFAATIKNRDHEGFKMLAFDTLSFKGNTVAVNLFIENYFQHVFNDSLFDAIGNDKKVDFIESEMDRSVLPFFILGQLRSGKCFEKIINITEVDKDPPGQIIIILKFIDTKNGYRFYGYDRIG